jgi:hypothetical protein
VDKFVAARIALLATAVQISKAREALQAAGLSGLKVASLVLMEGDTELVALLARIDARVCSAAEAVGGMS